MRALAISAFAATAMIALGAGSVGATPARSHTALTVTYWENGDQSTEGRVWTVRCNPPRGTHRRVATACRRLAEGGPKLFARVRPTEICTQVYGGPQEARVVGTLEGRRIWATFNRKNGCHISRWNRLSPWLLPRVSSSS